MPNFPKLVTEKLLLRNLEVADWESISYLRSDKTINQFIKRENADTKEKALHFIEKIHLKAQKNEIIYWCISLKNKPKMVGSISIRDFSNQEKSAEIGYDLDPEFQNKGIMNEAMLRVLKFAFEDLNLQRIDAFTQCQNKNSIQLLHKNGFVLNPTRKDLNNSDNLIFELARAGSREL